MRRITEAAHDVRELGQRVTVVRGELPVGLELADDGRTLKVMADYRERYDVLGTVTSQHAHTREELAARAMWLL